MDLTNFKLFVRNFQKQKTVGILSISCLSISIAVAILIGLWGLNELSFDNFHEDKDEMYLLHESVYLNNENKVIPTTFRPFGEEAQAALPEIKDMCRVAINLNDEIWIDNIMQKNVDVFVTDSNFFNFFTFPLKVGNPQEVLSAPNHMVIDESTARKYFPNENPVGKIVKYENRDWNIVGIMYDMPVNSHIQGNIVVPWFGWYATNGWAGSDGFATYFKISKGVDVPVVNEKLTNIMLEAMPFFEQLQGKAFIRPLEEVHFSDYMNSGEIITGNKSLVLVFLFTALVILIIACINFTNLFISTSFLRAKTIGIKKTHGADKKSFIFSFYQETLYYVLISVVLGLIIARILLSFFNNLAQSNISIDFTSPLLYLFLFALIVITTLIAGLFPAFYMTKFNALETLRGQFKGQNLSLLQKSLIVCQFTATIVFLTSVFFINKQVHYMISKDLGFDKENVLYVFPRDNFGKNYETLKTEFLQYPFIKDITQKNGLPTDWRQGWSIGLDGADDDFLMEICRVRDNYFDLLGMEIVEGVNPFYTAHDSLRYCVINESAARILGLTQPIDQPLRTFDKIYTIKGVVKDAQTKSLHQRVDPQVYMKFENWGDSPIMFKIEGDPQEAIRVIEAKWNQLVPNVPFEYGFLDETYAKLYKAETNAGKIFSAAMVICLIISIVGLFAMAFYSTQRRIKEIGVRKVNGATVSEILLILNVDFVKWVIVSFVLAVPISYLIISNWLTSFQAKTSISWWVFAVVGLVVLLVALITVSYQTWKAANVNPVKALKNE